MRFLWRPICQLQRRLHRSYATGSKLVEQTHDNETSITTLSMQSAPVNSLNVELLSALKSSLIDAKKNGSRGIILTSSLPTVFSAGLDIMEMYNRSEGELTQFWTTLQDLWLTLYSSEVPVAAAINGASPAGGCLLAISCEYRVFVEGKHTIGLNETQLGIIAPKWFRDVYIDTMGYRNAEIALLRGSLFKPEQALKLGLVDELASNKEEAIKKCQSFISSFQRISPQARSATKLELRKDLITWLKQNQKEDVMQFLKFVQLPQVQKGLKLYVESLKQKK